MRRVARLDGLEKGEGVGGRGSRGKIQLGIGGRIERALPKKNAKLEPASEYYQVKNGYSQTSCLDPSQLP